MSFVYDFRNTYVAHQEQELKDRKLAERAVREWIETLAEMRQYGRKIDQG